MRKMTSIAFGLIAVLTAAPAVAQKSQDTLRIAINNPFSVLSQYDLPVDDSSMFSRDVYENLLYYDEYKQTYVPGLAKSWKRIDEKTLEFELRNDIKFHNGNKFDADDAIATFNYITDPKSKITYQNRFTWMKEIEKVAPNRIRIHAAEKIGTDLARLAYYFSIWDAETMAKLQDKADYGRLSPVGTGVLRVVEIDKNKGITVERWDQYNTQPVNKKSNVKRWHGIPMPDNETQAAQLMVNGVDLLFGVPPDQATALAANPAMQVTYVPSPTLIYLAIDSVNLSGNKALSDPRVRQAIFMGIDREEIIKYLVPGGQVAEHVQGDCFKSTIACSYSVLPPAYDPAGAKKLLAEAGYPDGIDVNYLVRGPVKPITEAIAGQLLKIGVRMKLLVADVTLYRRLQGDGKLEAWTAIFPTGSYPDAGNIFSVLFPGPVMKYYDDPVIGDAIKKGETEIDPGKRTAIYRKAFDRINEMHYHLPISSMPTVYVHSKDVRVGRNALSAGNTYVIDFGWN